MRRAHAQRGAALLLAMLTVTLVATFAATALWQQWRAVEVEQSERARSQSAWVLVGALDFSRFVLRLDGANNVDRLDEPWAVALQESRMSTFLGAENGVAQAGDEGLPEVFLSGSIIDLQSRMNVANLVGSDGQLIGKQMAAFKRLFELLGLPEAEFMTMAENLGRASQKQVDGDADVPLLPQRFEQLAWLGLSPSTLRVLEPYVTVLPQAATAINLYTASAQVIAASIEGVDLASAQMLVQARNQKSWNTVQDFATFLDRVGLLPESEYAVRSSFFEINGRLRMEGTVVSERSLVKRGTGRNPPVTTIWRERVAGDRQP